MTTACTTPICAIFTLQFYKMAFTLPLITVKHPIFLRAYYLCILKNVTYHTNNIPQLFKFLNLFSNHLLVNSIPIKQFNPILPIVNLTCTLFETTLQFYSSSFSNFFNLLHKHSANYHPYFGN